MHEGQGHQLELGEGRLQGFIDFVARTERDPLPDRLTWSTEDPERFGRRSWVSIDELTPGMERSDIDASGLLPRWGTRIQLRGKTQPQVPYGTLRAERVGNTVEVQTQGVRRFTLLLSAREFDLTREVRVVLDGKVVRAEVPEPSARTMLHRAARDDDRRCLFEVAWSFSLPDSK